REVLLEHGAQILRHAGHLVEARHAADVDPVPQLLHAHLALLLADSDRAERVSERGTRQPDQRGLRRRHIALERSLLDEAARGRFGLDNRSHRAACGAFGPWIATYLHSEATRSSAWLRPFSV